MSDMKKLIAAFSAVCAMSAASAGSASVLLNTGELSGLTQVHSTGSQGPAATVFGVTQGSGLGVSITGGSPLSVSGAGYAQFDGPFSVLQYGFTSYAGGFTATNFTLFADGVNGAKGVPALVDISAYGLGGVLLKTFDNVSLDQGVNKFNIKGDNSEVFSSIAFKVYSDAANLNARPIGDIRHIDLDVAPLTPTGVPEPATWAMLIVGFGAIGAAMRSRRKLAFTPV